MLPLVRLAARSVPATASRGALPEEARVYALEESAQGPLELMASWRCRPRTHLHVYRRACGDWCVASLGLGFLQRHTAVTGRRVEPVLEDGVKRHSSFTTITQGDAVLLLTTQMSELSVWSDEDGSRIRRLDMGTSGPGNGMIVVQSPGPSDCVVSMQGPGCAEPVLAVFDKVGTTLLNAQSGKWIGPQMRRNYNIHPTPGPVLVAKLPSSPVVATLNGNASDFALVDARDATRKKRGLGEPGTRFNATDMCAYRRGSRDALVIATGYGVRRIRHVATEEPQVSGGYPFLPMSEPLPESQQANCVTVVETRTRTRCILAGCGDGFVRMWDERTGRRVGAAQKIPRNPVRQYQSVRSACAFRVRSGESYVVLADSEGTVETWRV